MAARGGKDWLLKIGDGGGTEVFTTIAGLRTKSMSLNAESIEITNHDSSQWKTLLDNAGIRSLSASGSGVFTSDTTITRVRTMMMANTIINFQMIDSVSGDKFSFAGKITSLEQAGEYNGEMTYSISIESSGTVTFTAGP